MLPTTKREPRKNLSDYNLLIYGHPKIGKSTFCSQMDTPLFLATEPGLQALSVYEKTINSWSLFLEVCKYISEGKHQFKTIVIDTVDILYKLCVEYMLGKLEIQHEGDLPFGKGYALIKEEFMRVIRKLSLLPYGLVMTSHVDLVEVKTRTEIYNKAQPTIPKSARDIIVGMVDIILYADALPDGTRIVHTHPSEKWVAGDRTENAFGRVLPEVIPLNFEEFQLAFYGGEIR
jgi:hypothetical protein